MGERKRPLLVALTALLPFTFLPHELGLRGFPIAALLLALTIFAGVRYRSGVKTSAPEVALWVFAVAILIRMLLLPFEGDAIPVDQVISQIGGIVAAVILLRLGRRAELRPTILFGLTIALILMLVFEGYQIAAGLPRLQAAGYLFPEFIYHTESGSYRPFGTFRTPVTFGAYLAMVGIAVALSNRGIRQILLLAATALGLLGTETRSAWIAFAAAGIVALFAFEGVHRRRLALLIGLITYGGVVAAVAIPGLFDSVFARLGTLTDSSYGSNSIRVTLWTDTLAAAAQRPLEGWGLTPLAEVLPAGLGETFTHPHNNFIQIFFIYGLLGLIPFVAFLGTTVAAFRKRGYAADEMTSRAAGLAVITTFVICSLFESMWSTFSVLATLGLLVGLGMPAVTSHSDAPRLTSRDLSRGDSSAVPSARTR